MKCSPDKDTGPYISLNCCGLDDPQMDCNLILLFFFFSYLYLSAGCRWIVCSMRRWIFRRTTSSGPCRPIWATRRPSIVVEEVAAEATTGEPLVATADLADRSAPLKRRPRMTCWSIWTPLICWRSSQTWIAMTLSTLSSPSKPMQPLEEEHLDRHPTVRTEKTLMESTAGSISSKTCPHRRPFPRQAILYWHPLPISHRNGLLQRSVSHTHSSASWQFLMFRFSFHFFFSMFRVVRNFW